MADSERNSAIIVLVMLGCLTHSETGFAQSVDRCMSASTSDALQVCKNILENGSRNSDVYWKLASAQFQDGQEALANKTLNEALRLHPGNAKLLALQDIISSATSEQELIARSAKLNQSSLDKGALKISCLVKSGQEAISACKRRLELTNDDGERIQARLDDLQRQQTAKTNITFDSATSTGTSIEPAGNALSNTTPERTALQADTASGTLLQDTWTGTDPSTTSDAAQVATESRREAYMELVTEVQTRLNEMGFSAGYPDGVPGNRTRSALGEFYTAVETPGSTSVTNIALEDIKREQRKLISAQQHLGQSERAFRQGNRTLAEEKLRDARVGSKLLKVPAEFEQELRTSRIATLPSAPATVPQVSITPSNSTVQQSTDSTLNQSATTPQTSTSDSQPFTELMDRINLLNGKIRRQEADREQQLERIRSVSAK